MALKRARNIAWYFLDRTLAPFLRYCRYSLAISPDPSTNLLAELNTRAVLETADYIQAHMPKAIPFKDRKSLWKYAFGKRTIDGTIAEFGVWKGQSINYIASLTQDIVFGFDSFEGLREDWRGTGFLAGHFSLRGDLPKVRKNAQLIKGWFSETLPLFLKDHHRPFSFIHIDSDTYDTAKELFNLIAPHLVSGTIMVFDEYFGYRGWKEGEYKAWQECVASSGLRYEYLAFSNVMQVVMRVTS
jgi:hypothetical protein